MSSGKNILFICPTTTQPRFHKRIQTFLDNGWQVTVYGYERGYYKQNKLPKEARFVSMGEVVDGVYLTRIPMVIKSLGLLKKEVRTTDYKVVYAFGPDNALLACLLKTKAKIVYELGDLRITERLSFVVRSIFNSLDSFLFKRIDYLVLTSHAFQTRMEEQHGKKFPFKTLIVENKLGKNLCSISERKPTLEDNQGRIKIGLVGLLRYKTIFPLLQAVKDRPEKYELHIHGAGFMVDDVKKFANECENISFFGSFKNPDDIPDIYKKIELSFVVYDNADLNVRLALPNKLYESVWFGIPIIVAENTFLYKKVQEYEIGYAISCEDESDIGRLLDRLDRNQLRAIQEKALQKPDAGLINDDSAALSKLLEI